VYEIKKDIKIHLSLSKSKNTPPLPLLFRRGTLKHRIVLIPLLIRRGTLKRRIVLIPLLIRRGTLKRRIVLIPLLIRRGKGRC